MEHRIAVGEPVTINGAGGPLTALPFRLNHGNIDALGFRFGDLAYTPDLDSIPAESEAALIGLDTWIRRRAALRAASEPFLGGRRARRHREVPAAPRRADQTAQRTSTSRRSAPSCRQGSPAYDGLVIETARVEVDG